MEQAPKTVFGEEMQEGDSLEMQRDLLGFFRGRTYRDLLEKYFYVRGSAHATKIPLDEFNARNLKEPVCSICGRRLYTFEHDESRPGSLEQKTLVVQKSCMAVQDRTGAIHLACFSASLCLAKASKGKQPLNKIVASPESNGLTWLRKLNPNGRKP